MTTTGEPVIPEPPRIAGDWQQDAQPVAEWMGLVYRRLQIEDEIGRQIEAAATVTQETAAAQLEVLVQSISATPTQGEVSTIQAQLNAVILNLRGEGVA